MRTTWSRIFSPIPWCGALLVVATAISACDEDDTVAVVPPPIEVRNVFPADGVDLDPAPAETFDLTVNFNRATPAGSILFDLHPPPAAAGDYGPTGTGRNWAWNDVELTADAGAYAWLIDGRDLRVPLIVRLITGNRNVVIGFEGGVASLDSSAANPRGTLVFGLPAFAEFNPLDPGTFLDLTPVWATVVRGAADNAGFWPYTMTYLADTDSFLVVAILDTDGDTVYDPTTDWWGYRRELLSTSPEIVHAASTFSDEYRGNADLTLGPPFVGRGTPSTVTGAARSEPR